MVSVGEGDTLRAQEDNGAGEDIIRSLPDKNPRALNASLLGPKKPRKLGFP